MGPVEMNAFHGRAAVVTGAAQSIGLSCAAALAREGAGVVIADFNLPAAEESAEILRSQGLTAVAMQVDVTEPDQVEAVAAETIRLFGHIDVWVNNAGVAHHYDSFDLPPDLWKKSIDVMLNGAFYGCQSAGRVMRGRGGSIINMASVNGLVSQPRRAAYASAKAGLVMLTRVLAAEWANQSIRVNGVAPSPIATSGMANWGASSGFAGSLYVERHPMKRMGELGEVVDAVLFLAGEDSACVTGETLCVDGGWVAYGYL